MKTKENESLVDTKTVGDAKLLAEFKYAADTWLRDMTPATKKIAAAYATAICEAATS